METLSLSLRVSGGIYSSTASGEFTSKVVNWYLVLAVNWGIGLGGAAQQELLAEGLSTSSHGLLHKAAWSSTALRLSPMSQYSNVQEKKSASFLRPMYGNGTASYLTLSSWSKQTLSLPTFRVPVEEEEVIRKNISSSWGNYLSQ